MAILVNLDLMLVRRKMSLTELADKVGLTIANLSVLKRNHARAIRFSTLNEICRVLSCQPGDILEYKPEDQEDGD
ncbi:MAG: helix-turn-helix domain-containing protein [candidate division Zixibacteria bacterium]|nr:helix-turn-helix domain-containing protein [candidate division Zixibacteria bacterium]